MSGFMERLRSRSKNRDSRKSGDYSNGRSSGDYGVRKSIDASARDRDALGDGQASQEADRPGTMDTTTRGLQAMRIDDHESHKNLPPLPPDATQRIQQAATGPVMDPVPPRNSSIARKPISPITTTTMTTTTHSRGHSRTTTPSKLSPSTPTKLVGHKTGRSQDLAPNDPSGLVPRQSPTSAGSSQNRNPFNGSQDLSSYGSRDTPYSATSSSSRRPLSGSQDPSMVPSSLPTRQGATFSSPTQSRGLASGGQDISSISQISHSSSSQVALPEHTRLPPGFNLRNGNETTVDTAWLPPVTHETAHHQLTEVIQETIQRDIHIDHYYHYVQPVKVVEILPARHFMLDEATGVKTEIPAPEGFELPAHMQPTAHHDLESLEATSRHYVVDEANPAGRAEDPPLAHKEEMQKMQRPPMVQTSSVSYIEHIPNPQFLDSSIPTSRGR